jgi:hypothetical protein
MKFTEYPSKPWDEILPGLESAGRDLVSRLVVYESGDRLSADEVCHFAAGEAALTIYADANGIYLTGIAAPLLCRDKLKSRIVCCVAH